MAIRHPFNPARTLAYADYRAGETVAIPIEVGMVLTELHVQISMDVVTGATPPTGLLAGHIAKLIRRFEVEVADRDQVFSMDGKGILFNAQLDNGMYPAGYTSPTFGANTTQRMSFSLPINFFLPNSQNPLLCALDLRGVPSANLRIQWGDITDIVRTVNNCSIANVTCEIVGVMLRNVGDAPRAMIREFNQRTIELTGDSSNWGFQVEKNTGKRLRSVRMFTTRSQFAFGPDSSDPIFNGDVTVQAGGQIFLHHSARFLPDRARLLRQFDIQTGMYPIYMSSYGDPGQMLDMNQLDTNLDIRASVKGPLDGTDSVKVDAYIEHVRALRL